MEVIRIHRRQQEANNPRTRHIRDRLNPLEGLSDEACFRRYRFRPDTVLQLTAMLAVQLNKATRRSLPLPALLQVCITLRFLASNSFLQVVGDTLNQLPKSTVWNTVHRVCRLLVAHTRQFVKFPVILDGIKQAFFEKAGVYFPVQSVLAEGHMFIVKKKKIPQMSYSVKWIVKLTEGGSMRS